MNETARDERLSRRQRCPATVGGDVRTGRAVVLATRGLLAFAALGSLAATPEPAIGQVAPAAATQPSIAALKREYLRCDRASSRSRLTLEAAAYCGAVGDELLRREFDGDLDLLLAWWRSARQAPLPEAGRGSS